MYIAKPEMYISKPAMYIPKFAIQNSYGKKKVHEGNPSCTYD